MVSCNFRSRTLGVKLMLICSALFSSTTAKPGRQASEILATFGQPIQIFGDMIRNDIDFVDGLKVNVYSPTNRTLTIEQNNSPLSGAFTTGSTGTAFRLARGYSYKFTTNAPSNDLIAQIAIPYDPSALANRSLIADNTFVAQLATDKKAWNVVDGDRTVQTTQFRTAMSQMTTLDGEYVILARNSQDTGNIFMEFGQGDQFSANFTGGAGRQDVEFMDGLRFAVQTDRPLRMNVQLKFPIAPEEVPQGMISLNSYAWVVNTTVNALIDAPAPPANASGNSTRLSTIGAASTQVPAATTIPLPQFPNSILPAISASPFVYAQPKKPLRIRRSPAGPEPIAMPGPGHDGGRPDDGPGPNGGFRGQEPGHGSGNGPDNGANPNNPFRGQQPGPAGMPSMMPPNPFDGTPIPFPVAPAAVSTLASMPGMSMSMPLPVSPPTPGPIAPPTPLPPPPPAAPSSPASPASPTSPAPPAAVPADVQAAQIQFPINMNILLSRLVPPTQGNANPGLAPLDLNTIAFTIGRRDANAPANTMFTPMNMSGKNNTGNSAAAGGVSVANGRLVFDSKTMLDGEYVILVPVEQGLGGAAPAKQGEAQGQGQGPAPAKAKGQQADVQKSSDADVVRGSVVAVVGAVVACVLVW